IGVQPEGVPELHDDHTRHVEPTSSPGTCERTVTVMQQGPAPPERRRDAPRRSHLIRFTPGVNAGAPRMNPGSVLRLDVFM
ncbi:hypothetical protein ACFXPN_47540, partial [Streptomyces griseorubiginosus]|uniref:hypothetical protein n=1 Tax=Streptomyces griseorubiginosus TaxID=67304 RepID=UPI0036938462